MVAWAGSDAALFRMIDEVERLPGNQSSHDALTRSTLSRSAPQAGGRDFQPAPLAGALDELDEQVAPEGLVSGLRSVAATGVLATAGYVLLNTRAGFWLLSLMTTRPLWKDFDPLEVVYAWENEDEPQEQEQEADKDKDGSLLSLVE
jgi:hypothetical protein